MKERMDHVLSCVAKQNNITVEEVRKAIKHALDEALRSQDPDVQAKWNLLSLNGVPPTPEELIWILSAICSL